VDVELRHLEAFRVLADELNFTRAAGRLHITQQALSTQLRQLEHRVGASLFERTTRTVALTDAGRTLLGHVPGILAAVDRAVAETRETLAGERGTLTVGLSGVAGLDLTPRVLRDFATARPKVALNVRNVDFSDSSSGLLSGVADVALLWLPVPDELEVVPLLEEPRLAVLAADHPLAAREQLSAEELAEQPFVWIEDMDAATRDFWTLAAHRGGRPPRIGSTISGFEDLFAAVRSGRAVSASPASVVRALPWTDLVVRPVNGLAPATLAVCRRSGDTRPMVDAFVRSALAAAGSSNSRESAAPR
jgi:DNA-binding transcriptional LysR family regulator